MKKDNGYLITWRSKIIGFNGHCSPLSKEEAETEGKLWGNCLWGSL